MENRVGFMPRAAAFMLDAAIVWALGLALQRPLSALFSGAVAAMIRKRLADERDTGADSRPGRDVDVAVRQVIGGAVRAGEVTNLALVRAAAATGKPVLVSSGMSTWEELDAAVEAAGENASVLQCTSAYPTPPERVGLNLLADRFAYVVGGELLGDPASPVRFQQPWQGAPVPDTAACARRLRVIERRGCDPAPAGAFGMR